MDKLENLVIDDIFLNSRLTVVDSVYDLIKKNILNWNLKPGQRISEKDVSEHLKVSKTPVRESFIRLGKEKMIDILPQRGSFVSKIDMKDVEEGLFIRRSLELAVLELAISNISHESLTKMKGLLELQKKSITDKNYEDFLGYDLRFHKEIFYGSHKERTWKVMSDANTQYRRVRMLTLIDINKYELLVSEHYELLSALEAKDLLEAKRVMEDHLGKLYFEEKILKSKYPDYFK